MLPMLADTELQPALENETVSHSRLWLMICLFAVVAGIVLFYELGNFKTLGSHEVFAVVPAREMVESGNWVVPRFGGIPRLRKPPLVYWVLAVTDSLFGELNEWTVRMPAALSALALSVLMGFWAGRWYGKTAGFAAALAQVTCVYVIIYSRKAEVDMMLCLLTTAAMFLIAEEQPDHSKRSRFFRWTGIFVLLSLSWLAKFHYGPAMVMVPCVLYWLIQKRYRSFRNLANPVGLMIFAAAVLVWPYLLLLQIPDAWEVWMRETVGRAVGELGTKPIWYYLPYILWLTLPWTPLALSAIPASWKRAWKQADARERFLWIWFLTQLVIVSISANKHKHYLMASLPMFSLLVGQQFAVIVRRVREGKPLLTRRAAVFWYVVSLAGAVVVPVVAISGLPSLRIPCLMVSMILAVGGPLTVWLIRNNKASAGGYAFLVVFLGCFVTATGWIIPRQDHRLAATNFSKEIREELTSDKHILIYGMDKDEVVYYLDSPVSRTESLDGVTSYLFGKQKIFVVTYEDHLRKLANIGHHKVIKRLSVLPDMAPPKHPPLVLIELTSTGMSEMSANTQMAPTDKNRNSPRLATEPVPSDAARR
jgi:4-amino-4-deoxy-L-arabinose transferase-like glycosyltransferase